MVQKFGKLFYKNFAFFLRFTQNAFNNILKNVVNIFCLKFILKFLDFGQLAYHILSPINIIPTFLDRSQSQQTNNHQNNNHKNSQSQSTNNLFQVIF